MIFIPGPLIALLTFPGVIAHEVAHRFFADLARVPVYQVCYFRVGNPAGYVVHGAANGLKSAFLISVGPLIVNTVLCSLITFSAVFPLFVLDAKALSFIYMILIWVGFSIGMHAFPSNQDMKGLIDEIRRTKKSLIPVLAARAFAGLFAIANVLRIVWFDAIYAVGVSMLLPWLFGLY
jgi:hypothetical protein